MSTLAGMTHHVLAQSIWTHEFLATSRTAMWTFTCVRTAMIDDSAATCKAFVAYLARVGTFSRFYVFHPCVRLKFGFGFKCSWALSAQKGLCIPRVSRVVMYLQKREDKKNNYVQAVATCIFLPFHTNNHSPSSLTFRRLMSYIYGAPILDVSRSHTTQHSR